jgi:2,4-dienoyl-CoA reductase (NADPH2)
MPAMGLHFSEGFIFTKRYQNFYRERALGGVGLMFIGPVAIDEVGNVPYMPAIFEDRHIEEFRPFLEELKRTTDTKIGIQLFHMGRNAPATFFLGRPAIAPSPIRSRLNGQVPREMTKDDIETVQDAFAAGARRAKAAGFDYVEIICNTGYLINQFLAPVSNRRQDEYGGSFENRMRFGMEVIQKVRKALGMDFPLGIRVSGNDFVEGGLANDDVSLFCMSAEQAGIDAVNVTGGWHETNIPQLTTCVPPGAFVYLARGIKEKVQVPVFASNRLGDPVVAEGVLRSGSADMICMGRPLIADPELPRKVREGRTDEIVRCIACNQGCFDALFENTSVACVLNPRVGREAETMPKTAGRKRKIYVAGGGPAGMSFAMTAARRGHDVTLFEKEPRLGGQIDMAAAAPGKKEFGNIVFSMETRMRRAGVRIRLKSPLTAAKVKKNNPDIVVVATGAAPMNFPVPGGHKPHVFHAWDVLRGRVAHIGKQVVVIGANSVGCETAEYIAREEMTPPEVFSFLSYQGAEKPEKLQELMRHRCRQVTLIDMAGRMAQGMGRSSRWVLIKNLKLCGIGFHPGTKVVEITDDAVIAEEAGIRKSIPADTVVIAVGSRSVRDLDESLRDSGIQTILIGDAKQARKLTEAIREGFDEALEV